MTKKNLTIIIGAGASYNCVNPEITQTHGQYTPPKVDQLFENRQNFNTILHNFPRLEAASHEIRKKIVQGETIEGILRNYEREENLDIKRSFWEIPFYLDKLFDEISTHYITSGATVFETLIRETLRSKFNEILLLTTNYDLFIERALRMVCGIEFDNFKVESDYIEKDRFSLVKLHGSVHWRKKITNLKFEDMDSNRSISKIITHLDNDPLLDNNIINPKGRSYKGENEWIKKHYWYPAIAAPIQGKHIFMCPENHLTKAKQIISNSTCFIFIGFSAIDIHVLELLKDVKKVEKYIFVNGNTNDGIDANVRLNKVANIFRKRKNNIYDGGFVNFMENDNISIPKW